MSQINNTAQRCSRNRRHRLLRDKDTRAHRLPQLIRHRDEIRKSAPRHKTTVLPRGGTRRSIRHRQILLRVARPRGKTPRSTLHLPMIKGGRRLFPKCTLPMIGIDASANEGRKRTVERPQTLMSPKRSPGRRTYTLHSPPLSSVLPSTTPKERAPQTTPRPRKPHLHAVHQMDRGYRSMAPSYRP